MEMFDGDEKEFDKVTKFVRKVTMNALSNTKGKLTKHRRGCCNMKEKSRWE
jgi:hypothetical protein